MSRVRRFGVRVWRCLWPWGRALWVCRVPAAGALGGGLILSATPQARDLFADLGLRWYQWLAFFALVFAWGWIVHAVGRRTLQYDAWVAEALRVGGLRPAARASLQRAYFWPAVIIPRLLGFCVFAFVGIAIYRTRANLLPAAAGLPEAAEALVLANWLLPASALTGAAYVLVVWKRRRFGDWLGPKATRPPSDAPLLTGARPILAALRRRRLGVPATTRWRLTLDVALTAAAAVIGFGLLVSLIDPHTMAQWLPRLFFAPLLFGGAVLLVGEVAAYSHRVRAPLLLGLVLLSAGLLWWFDRFHDTRWINAVRVRSAVSGPEQQISLAEAVERWMAVNGCAGADCPRPILIAGAGGASRAAFLTATVVGSLIDLGRDPATAATYGDVRKRIFAMSTVSGSSLGAVVIRAALADAAARGTPDTPPCRHAGRGSWFGFRGGPANDPRGYQPEKSWRDCLQVVLTGDFLSPALLGLAFRDLFPLGTPWSNDPWWPDRAALLEQGFERRYHWITRQDGEMRSCGTPRRRGTAEEDKSGLCRPFGYHPHPREVGSAWLPILFVNGTSVAAGRRIIVGDVRAGDHYVVGRGTAHENVATLFPLAHDLNEIRTWAPPSVPGSVAQAIGVAATPRTLLRQRPAEPARERDRDIRLSTAATMSARFPLISPHGLLRDRTGDVVDRIVDGGYFENEGLATIADVVSALKAFGLAPVVIRIVNEPVDPERELRQLAPDRPPIPDAAERTPFDDVWSIVRAITAVRSGHEEGHAAYLTSVIGPSTRLHHIGVFPLIPEAEIAVGERRVSGPKDNPLCRHQVGRRATLGHVSMSWWMSQPLQAYLDAQLCVRANWRRLLCELERGRTADSKECEPVED